MDCHCEAATKFHDKSNTMQVDGIREQIDVSPLETEPVRTDTNQTKPNQTKQKKNRYNCSQFSLTKLPVCLSCVTRFVSVLTVHLGIH